MNRLSRATALKIAAVISFLLGLWGFAFIIPDLLRGANAVNQGLDAPPFFVIVLGFAMSVVRIVATFGAWQNRRWGVILTILANALDTLSAVPGILFATTPNLWRMAIIDVILSVSVIVLCLWRDRKRPHPNPPLGRGLSGD